MNEILVSPKFWRLALPLIGAIIAWYVNESQKRLWEQYQRKEASYKELVRCLRGFYAGATDAARLRGEFLDQLNQCWLYCPDEVILRGYDFLNTVHADSVKSHTASDAATIQAEQQKAMGDFIAAIRRDVLSPHLVRQTDLTGSDFRHLGVSPLA